MKKLILLSLLFLLCGCSIVRIDTSNIDNIIGVVLSKNNNLYNQIGKGYKYYIPRGVSYMDTNDYNDVLYSDGNYYYLYIDVVSYYYNVVKEYEKDENGYYSQPIEVNGKKGYLEINEQDNGRYFIEFMYNYSKMEAEVDYDDINNVILNMSYMLSTIKFNDNVIKVILDDDFLVSEEKYDIFTSKKESNDFLKLESEPEDEVE